METANNRIEINKINSDMISLEKQISDVAEGLKDVVTKSELADMMNSFVSVSYTHLEFPHGIRPDHVIDQGRSGTEHRIHLLPDL